MTAIVQPVNTAVATTAGLMGLAVGALGDNGAEVLAVILAANAGLLIALSAEKTEGLWETLRFVLMANFVSLALSWVIVAALASLADAFLPSVSGALRSFYAPAGAALIIGIFVRDLGKIPGALKSLLTILWRTVLRKAEEKAQ